MTDLAYACVRLEIPVDPIRLYESDDPYLTYWLAALVERVAAFRRAEAARVKAKTR